jgi:N-acetylmuramoyl-L-alanine amidase
LQKMRKLILIGTGLLLLLILLPLKAEAASFRYTVRPGDTIFKLSQRFYVSQEEIIKINGLKNPSLIHPGQIIIIPDGKTTASRSAGPLRSSTGITNEDLRLLAQVVYGEARGEPYLGQVAVAAVVLNRVKSNDFPNTIRGVIFQPWAFTAVHDGQFYLEPDATAWQAAAEAARGVDPTGGALYYWNPARATNSWIWTRPIIWRIGNHVFAR